MLALSSLLALAAGCARPKPIDVVVGIDVSGGARAHLGGYVAIALQLAERLNPCEDRLTVVRLERRARVVLDGVVEGDSESVGRTLRRELVPAAQGGTVPAAFWRVAEERVVRSQAQGYTCYVLLLTDGDNDAPATASEVNRSARRLAGCRALRKVVLVGIDAVNRAALERDLAPLGARLQPILGSTELNPEKVLAFLREAGR